MHESQVTNVPFSFGAPCGISFDRLAQIRFKELLDLCIRTAQVGTWQTDDLKAF